MATTINVTVRAKCPHAVVVHGKKVPLGTVGEVFWVGDSKYGPGFCAGFKYLDGRYETKVFINADNLERIPSESELAEYKAALEKESDAKLLALLVDLDVSDPDLLKACGGDLSNYEEARLAQREIAEDPDEREFRGARWSVPEASEETEHQRILNAERKMEGIEQVFEADVLSVDVGDGFI